MALAVVRALGENGVPVVVLHCDPRDIAQVSRYVVADIRVPHPVHNERGFIEALIEAGQRLDGAILMPASDESTVAVSRHKALLGARYVVGCPDWDITEQFIDKTKTNAVAERAGVAIPKTVIPRGPDPLESRAAEIGFPLLLKPAESHPFSEHFKRKMVRVETFAELHRWYTRSSEARLQVMLQGIVPGPDSSVVNYNAYAWNGVALVEFTARQLRKARPPSARRALPSASGSPRSSSPVGRYSGQWASTGLPAPSSSWTSATASASSWTSTGGPISPGCWPSAAASTSRSWTTGP